MTRTVTRRTFMAGAAGTNNVVPRQSGFSVARWQDIVGAMAILAFGCRLAAQLSGLAVVGFEIRLGELAVAFTAMPNHLLFKIGTFCSRDRVRLMA